MDEVDECDCEISLSLGHFKNMTGQRVQLIWIFTMIVQVNAKRVMQSTQPSIPDGGTRHWTRRARQALAFDPRMLSHDIKKRTKNQTQLQKLL
jgi:hypothetical protein